MRLYFLNFAYCLLCLKHGFCNILSSGLTAQEEKIVLNAHNVYRKAVATWSNPRLPKGINIKNLKYDSQLAKMAQKTANSKIYAETYVCDARWDNVGMTILKRTSSGGSDWAATVKEWFDDGNQYSYSKCCTPGTEYFTQIIWADTQYIGCGWVAFEEAIETFLDKSNEITQLYVCYYGPSGNYVGQYPYKNGTDKGSYFVS